MKAVWLEVDEEFLERRRRLGQDRRDEVWDGVLHMVPPPKIGHASVQQQLCFALDAIGRKRGLRALTEAGFFDPAVAEYKNFRVPDVVMFSRDDTSDRGVEGRAELVIEVLSPNDESREKLPFYERMGVREVWLVDRKMLRIEIFAGTHPIEQSQLGLELHFEGPVLHIRDGADTYTVDTADLP